MRRWRVRMPGDTGPSLVISVDGAGDEARVAAMIEEAAQRYGVELVRFAGSMPYRVAPWAGPGAAPVVLSDEVDDAAG